MKRLLIITSTFPRWKNDTTPEFVFELAKNISLKKINVSILAPHYKNAKFYEIIEKIKIFRFPYFYPLSFQKVSYDGGVLPNLKRSNLAKIQVIFFLISEFFLSLFLSIKNKIEVINSHWIIPHGFIGAIIKKLTKKKHIIVIHAGDLSLLEKLPFRRNILSFIIKNSDLLIFVSNHGKKRLSKLVKDELLEKFNKIAIKIPMGVYTKNFRKLIIKSPKNKYLNKKNIIFIGRLTDKKGLIYLVKAMPIVFKKIPNCTLTIVGDGPLKKSLEENVKNLNIENKILFVGYKIGKEKVNLLESSDILVVPSIKTKDNDEEGLPVVLMEGLATGKAIIATRCGGIPEIIKDQYNGLLINQKSSKELAEKIIYLLKNPIKSRILEKNALNSGKKYDWQIIAKQYSDIIKNI